LEAETPEDGSDRHRRCPCSVAVAVGFEPTEGVNPDPKIKPGTGLPPGVSGTHTLSRSAPFRSALVVLGCARR